MALLVFLALPFTAALRGWILFKCWGWFVVPLGVRPIQPAWAYGLIIVGALVTGRLSVKAEDISRPSPSSSDSVTAISADVLIGLLALLCAWVAHQWMT